MRARVTTTMVTLGTIVRHTGALCSPRAVLSGRAFPLPWIQHLPSIYRGKSSAGATRTQIARGTSTRGFASSTAPRAASARDQQDVFDFETHIDRANTGSLKWDRYKGKDVIPLWVADMDLKTAPAIVAAVHDRLDHGIFGYTSPTEGAQEAVMKYYKVGNCMGFCGGPLRSSRCTLLSFGLAARNVQLYVQADTTFPSSFALL